MQPLPSTWIEAIFTRLSGIYGSRFTNMWASVEPDLVRNTWALELAGFDTRPKCIKYALEHLPTDHPPTAIAFRKLCNMAPDDTPLLEHEGYRDSDRLARELGKLRNSTTPDPKDWARRILARVEAGEKVTPISARFAREALRLA